MRPSVLSVVDDYQCQFEGRIPWMYLDVKSLVTVGVGNLIDPVARAVDLPFRKPDGALATPAEIYTEWHTVKASDTAAKGAGACRDITTLRLTRPDIDALVENAARSFECELTGLFPQWETWPANAQLGMLGVAWAVGVGKIKSGFSKFVAACKRMDWATAAQECLVNSLGNPGVVPRNRFNRNLFLWAAEGGNPEVVSDWKTPPVKPDIEGAFI